MLSRLTMILSCCCIQIFFGCSGDRGYVQREWSLSLRELGIVPVFPPREDIVVGDVYAYTFNPESAENQKIFETPWKKLSRTDKARRLQMGMSPRLTRLNLNCAILQEYQKSISAPATSPDYNSIFGNPALAAADEKVKAAEGNLNQLKEKVATAKKAAADAQAALVQRTREKEDADAKVAEAEAKHNSAKNAPVDTKREEGLLHEAKAIQREREDKLVLAQRNLQDAGDDEAKKEAATQALKVAEREKADADLAVARAQQALDAKKATKPDVSELEGNLAAAKEEQRVKAQELIAAQRHKDDLDAKASAEAETLRLPIEDAIKAVDSAKAIRTAIAEAGARMLYAQPVDANADVFTNMPLGVMPLNGLGNSRVNRLRLVGFPEFSTVSFTQGDLSALIPLEAMSLGINISKTNVSKVAVKVPAAESYALSLQKVIKGLGELKTDNKGTVTLVPSDISNEFLQAALFQTSNLQLNDQPKDADNVDRKIYFRLVTEVFYARALDVSIFSASAFGTRAQARALVPTTESPVSGTPTHSGDPMTPVPVNTGAVGTSTGVDMLSSLQARLATTQTVPGGSVQLVSYSEKSIGVRRVFDRPIAIGFRGLTLEYDVANKRFSQVIISQSGVSARPD